MPAILSDDRFAAAAERLPTTPQVFDRLAAALKDPDVGVEEIASVVQLDAALAARVMRLSNSAHFGRGGERTNHLADAVNRLGFQEVYRLVGVAMSANLYIAGLPVYGLGGDELWLNSLTTAVAMEMLADRIGADRRVGYTLGLLRPVGRLLVQRLASGAPLSGRKSTAALVMEWEKNFIGLNNCEAVERLFRVWQFSPALAAPIRFHFEPETDPDRGRFTALLHIACWMTQQLGKGLSIEADAWHLSESILLQAGLPHGAAEESLQKTGEAAEKLAGAMNAA